MTRPRKLGLVLLFNTLAGIIPGAWTALFRPDATVSFFLIQVKFGLIYAHLIGSLSWAAMHYLGPCLKSIPLHRRIAAALATFVATSVAGAFLAALIFLAVGWISLAEFGWTMRHGVRVSLAITLVLGTLVMAFEILSHRLQEATLEIRTRQLAEERSRKLATEAQLSSLESRIHPHFLFNTLNSISALIREDPARAERTVERLAALLRYSLDTHAQRLVPLRQELQLVRDYLDIEKTRFGDRLRYEMDTQEGIGELEVPPLALQTLVENSIKHAISLSRNGGLICIDARLAPGRLLLEVSDDGPGFDRRALKEGHGLENLRDRLAALFDGGGTLAIDRRDGRTIVSIAVPQKNVLL